MPRGKNNEIVPAIARNKKRGGGGGGGAGKPDNDPPSKRRRSLMELVNDEDSASSDSSSEVSGPITRSKTSATSFQTLKPSSMDSGSKTASMPIQIPKSKRYVPQEMEEDEDEEEEEEDDDEYMEDEESVPATTSFQINIGSFEEPVNPMIPKRHDMKKEPAIVKKFVDLVTKPVEEVGIDAQIDQFKAMDHFKQQELLDALERRPTPTDSGAQMMFRILTMKIDPELKSMALAKYQALQGMDTGSSEYYKQRSWLDKFCSMPFGD